MSQGNALKSRDAGIVGYVVILVASLYVILLSQGFWQVIQKAYQIRMHAIETYGRVIHEFDPYFNYRATEYLYANGWKAFANWYDNMVWYPLGRPVGTTIYPGMQVTSVFIKNHLLPDWSINDICCFVPAWFGSIATIGTALLTYECSADAASFTSGLAQIPIINVIYRGLVVPLVTYLVKGLEKVTGSMWGLHHPGIVRQTPAIECAFFAAAIMSIVPAHLMRSVGGGYDNESVATTAMVFTFWAWTRSLRETTNLWTSTFWGVVTGLCYFYMAAAWGGYVFVLNLIGVHASFLVILGKYSSKLHRAYSGFYFIGTCCATQIPVIGMTPLKSLEQLGPFVAFVGIQLLEYCHVQKKKRSLTTSQTWTLRIKIFAIATAVAGVMIFFLAPSGYFGPFSSRIRGLFVKHTKTGNPLVDSVAEHQAASPQAYFQYLSDICYVAPVGFGLVGLIYFNDSSSFLIVYGVFAYYFSLRMVRLVLLTAPIASVLGGIALGYLWNWMTGALFDEKCNVLAAWETIVETLTQHTTESEKAVVQATPTSSDTTATVVTTVTSKSKKDKKKGGKPGGGKKKTPTVKAEELTFVDIDEPEDKMRRGWLENSPLWIRLVRLALSAYLIRQLTPRVREFYDLCDRMAVQLSHPTIIQKGRTNDGREVLIDDYREAYFWLRDNTPEDARIMAWWDYGYQITGISNRTTIADGNTWNHEHIALLGRTLTAPEKEGHRIARHLADYVLVWAGGGGDDLAKSPHLIRIANSVYRGLCAEPTCRHFGFYSHGEPSPDLAESMLYKLHSHGLKPGVEADRNRFKLIYNSKYGKVRIFKILKVSKESKEWVANPDNRLCDAGGWLCRGQYPPPLQKILDQKKDFKQLEDFNAKGGDDSEYQREYMENVMGGGKVKAPRKAVSSSEEQKDSTKLKLLQKEDINAINQEWEDTEATSLMWELVSKGHGQELMDYFRYNPKAPHMRSADGRGPMWWAQEFDRTGVIALLKKLGVSDRRKDVKGLRPSDV